MAAHLCCDCRTAAPSIRCCDELLCLLHAHCTRHAQHPALWKVIDKSEHARTLPAVNAVRQKVIEQLEHDLAQEAAVAVPQGSALGKPVAPGQPVQPAAAFKKPALPTFAEIRKRAQANASLKSRLNSSSVTQIRGGDVAADGSSDTGGSEGEDVAGVRSARKRNQGEFLLLAGAGADEGDGVGDAAGVRLPPSKRARLDEGSAATEARHDAEPAAGSGTGALPADPLELIPAASAAPGAERKLREAMVAVLAAALRDGCVSDVMGDPASAASAAAAPPGAAAALPAGRCVAASGGMSQLAARAAREMADAVVLKPQALAALAEGFEAGILLHVSGGSTGDAYRQHARVLAAALREPDNAQLRQRLLSGSMAPGQLALVPQTELASGAVRAQHRRIEEDMHRPAREFGAGMWMPTALPCPSCSGRSTEYMPAMEQRDIRKAEVWGGADTESRYRVHCRQCDGTWFTDSVY